MKIYKHYFDKKQTPFAKSYQEKKEYHTAWYRKPYKDFLGHGVKKIKLFGIITIYESEA